MKFSLRRVGRRLSWLERDLAATTRPVLVFCHRPLDEQDPARKTLPVGMPEFVSLEGGTNWGRRSQGVAAPRPSSQVPTA
jgi:hypothetical protein